MLIYDDAQRAVKVTGLGRLLNLQADMEAAGTSSVDLCVVADARQTPVRQRSASRPGLSSSPTDRASADTQGHLAALNRPNSIPDDSLGTDALDLCPWPRSTF